MGFNINDIGKQIVVPLVGLYLDGKGIPVGSKGEINSIDYETERIFIRWLVDGKGVTIYLTFSQFEQLEKSGVILEVSEYEEPPTPKFEVGDLVEGCAAIGIVKSMKFDSVNNSWWYRLYQLEGIFSDDYILRYDNVEEKYLNKLEGEVCIDIDYLKDRVFELKIQEKK